MSNAPTAGTVPCQVTSFSNGRYCDSDHHNHHQYRTAKTLGSGTYAIVKEAIHIKTGKYYACKVINKKLMEGREFKVRRRRRYHHL
jgi:serine/threonine protein kinase